MKLYLSLLLVPLILSCSGKLKRVEYSGEPLPFSDKYSIRQATSSMLIVEAPPKELLLINMYTQSDSLLFTLYQDFNTRQGSLMLSLARPLQDHNISLQPGTYKIVLFGKTGRAEFNAVFR